MPIKAIYEKQDEIPEAHRDLFTERDGKFELTGVEGYKTDADVARVQEALRKEKSDAAALKDKLKVWGDLDHEDVVAKLDKFDEYKAAAEGKVDDEKLAEMADARAKSQVAPVQRQLDAAVKENEELKTENEGLRDAARRRTIQDAVRTVLADDHVIPEAFDDALLLAERVFEVAEDGVVITRDNVGVTPGISPKDWLSDIKDKRPHWWPPTKGGGAGGGKGGAGADNPWTKENWNVTAQARFIREHGEEKAKAAAERAGVRLGAIRPAA